MRTCLWRATVCILVWSSTILLLHIIKTYNNYNSPLYTDHTNIRFIHGVRIAVRNVGPVPLVYKILDRLIGGSLAWVATVSDASWWPDATPGSGGSWPRGWIGWGVTCLPGASRKGERRSWGSLARIACRRFHSTFPSRRVSRKRSRLSQQDCRRAEVSFQPEVYQSF